MKAPSPSCLQGLRAIAFPAKVPCRCLTTTQRHYAALPSRPQPPAAAVPTSPKPNTSRASANLPPAPLSIHPPSAPLFRPTPSGPGLRKKRDDDEDFTPYPLTRPIGMPNPPQPGENTGLDHRTLRQRRDDFHDYDKHLEKRARMTKQLAKPYFRDWSNMRFHKGKVFVAPERLFRGDVSLWMPNFFGRTLLRRDRGIGSVGKKDGYGGLGRDTCEVMRGKVSIVSIVSNTWAENQVRSFVSKEANPGLADLMHTEQDVLQRVEINIELNWLKWWLLRLFGLGTMRRTRSEGEQARYFIVRRGISDVVKEAIGLLNDKGGYVYLVDQECRIRWAGSAQATEAEREGLVRGVRRLVQEAKTPREVRARAAEEKELLRETVADLTGGSAQTASFAA